ncbi:MAG: hypothetical protein AB1Z20_17960 [Desulfobacterales bacterium]
MKTAGLKCTLIIFSIVMFWGCGPRLMMPTPNIYLDAEQDIYNNLAADLKSTEVKIFYVTDRMPEKDKEGKLRYGYGR